MTTVILNGDPRELGERPTLAEALAAAGVPEAGRGVAVAVDGEVVPRARWAELELRSGQQVEVVQAVQGG